MGSLDLTIEQTANGHAHGGRFGINSSLFGDYNGFSVKGSLDGPLDDQSPLEGKGSIDNKAFVDD